MFEIKDGPAYFISRCAEETAAADAAATQKARIVHLELALRYSLLASQHSEPEGSAALTEAALVNLALQP